MKYLTKDWYEICQRTGLHYGMRVHGGAAVCSEALYRRLYQRKEKEYIKTQREVYDFDPRYFLKLYQMPEEEKDRIQKSIEEYDLRPPFDVERCREEFRVMQETIRLKEAEERLPGELLSQIADMRVFCLGYCTKEIKGQLELISKENDKKMKLGFEEYARAQKAENLPASIRERFGFHDCTVIGATAGKDFVMRLDTQGGFTDLNKITFINSEIVKQEANIPGSVWIYNELYCTEKGYEVHVLFRGEGMPELILSCNDILMEIE